MSTDIAEKTTFDAVLENLRSKGQQFSIVYQDFLNNRAYISGNPELIEKWDSINRYAISVKNTIIYINETVDSASNWLKNTIGLSGREIGEQSQNLGFIQVLPVAYLTAAIAALTYVIGQIVEFNTRVDLVKNGLIKPDQLNTGENIFASTSNLIKWGLIAAGVYLAWPVIMKKVKK